MIRIKTLMLAAAIFLSLTAAAQAQISTAGQPADQEWQRMIDRINLLVDNHFENRDYNEGQKANWNITGLSVGVYKKGRTAFFSRGFHESEQRKVAKRRPVTENSIFAIGSISKPVSTIMLSYFSRINNPRTGRPYVNLNDPVNNYFKTAPYIDTDGTRIHPTLLQFVTHRMGGATGGGSYTLAQFRALLENLTYTSKPGTAYEYSSGSTVVANVIASLYYNDYPQRRVNDLLQEHLFLPLGMNSTKLHGWIDPALQDRITLPHRFNGAAASFRSVPTSGINLGGASGCITSTAVDMMRLAAFILGDQVPRGSEILQQAAAAGIGWGTSNRSVPDTALTPYESNIEKMGGRFRELFTRPSNSGQRYGRSLEHGGALDNGHNAYISICPDTKTAVVVLVNNWEGRGSLAVQIMDRALNATYTNRRTAFNDFDDRVATYNSANANVDITLTQDLTIEAPVNNIRAPARAGATLTIRSANSARPVTLTRGVTGDLFTVPNGATLIFRDIIIDGGSNINFVNDEENIDEYDEDGNLLTRPETVVAGSLVRVNAGGTFIMESGAVLRNNINSGNGGGVYVNQNGTFTMSGGKIIGNSSGNQAGGVYVNRNSAFTMTGGEISDNTSATVAGGVLVYASTFTMTGGEIHGNSTGDQAGGVRISTGSTFTMTNGKISNNTAVVGGGVSVAGNRNVCTMTGGEISGNTASSNGGGVSLLDNSTFTMTGGIIFGNNAPRGNGVRISSGTFNLSGGVVAGTGVNTAAIVSAPTTGIHNLNTASPNNAVIIAWNRPSGALNYTVGTSTNLTVSAGGTATWANQGGVLSSEAGLGISYRNGSNTGWIKAW